jgi:hypothetical protein
VAGLKLVELRCKDEIAFSEAVDLVRPGGDLRLAPAQQNIRVMALRFRYLAYFIHESERSFEIGKRKRLRNVVFVDNLPSGHLVVRQNLSRDQRRAVFGRAVLNRIIASILHEGLWRARTRVHVERTYI